MIEFFTLLTDIGLSKLTNSAINGVAVDLKSIAIGDGSGDYYEPTSSQIELENEVFRADLNALIIDPDNNKRFSAQIIIPESSGGYTIREAGLFDADGDLIAVAKVPATFKPDNDSGAGAQIYFKILIECSEQANVTISITPSDLFITQEVLDVHLDDKTNPHAVTKAQVGLGDVDDTSDEDKPISTATQAVLDAHNNNKANPHTVTKEQLGLNNVTNERQYSAATPPPYPVTSVAGKTGAVTLTADDISGVLPVAKGGTGNSTGTSQYTEGMKFSDSSRKYKFQDLSVANPTDCMTFGTSGIGYTPLSTLKTALNLGNVNNTTDLAKPLSTATQNALNAKAPLANPTFTGTVNVDKLNQYYVSDKNFKLDFGVSSGVGLFAKYNSQANNDAPAGGAWFSYLLNFWQSDYGISGFGAIKQVLFPADNNPHNKIFVRTLCGLNGVGWSDWYSTVMADKNGKIAGVPMIPTPATWGRLQAYTKYVADNGRCFEGRTTYSGCPNYNSEFCLHREEDCWFSYPNGQTGPYQQAVGTGYRTPATGSWAVIHRDYCGVVAGGTHISDYNDPNAFCWKIA